MLSHVLPWKENESENQIASWATAILMNKHSYPPLAAAGNARTVRNGGWAVSITWCMSVFTAKPAQRYP
jgi:hypothetical protein